MVSSVTEKFNRSPAEKVKRDSAFDYISTLFFCSVPSFALNLRVQVNIYIYDDIGFSSAVDDAVEFKHYCRTKFYC